MELEEFSKKTVNLEDGFDPLPPATHPHVGTYSQEKIFLTPANFFCQTRAFPALSHA